MTESTVRGVVEKLLYQADLSFLDEEDVDTLKQFVEYDDVSKNNQQVKKKRGVVMWA